MKRLTILFCSLVLGMFLTAQAKESVEGARPGPGKMGPAEHKEMLKKEIGLTDEQIKKIEEVKIDIEKEVLKSKNELETQKLTLKEMSVKGTVTKAKMKETLDKIEAARAKIHAARHQGLLKTIDIFTEDQVKKIADKKMFGMFFEMNEGKDKPGEHEKHMKEMEHKEGRGE